jgi:translation initiation factor IF-2
LRLQKQQKDKKRLYQLVRELDVDLNDLLVFCKELGFDVKNQLSSLDLDQCDVLKQRVQRGSQNAAAARAPAARAPISSQPISQKVRVLETKKRIETGDAAASTASIVTEEEIIPKEETDVVETVEPVPTTTPVQPTAPEPLIAAEPTAVAVAHPQEETPKRPEPPRPAPTKPVNAPPQIRPADTSRPSVRDLNRSRGDGGRTPPPPGGPPRSGGPGPGEIPMVRRAPRSIRSGSVDAKPVVHQSLKQLAQHKVETKPQEKVLQPVRKLTDEQMKQIRQAQTKTQAEHVLRKPGIPAPIEIDEDEDERKRRGAGGGTSSSTAAGDGVIGRKERHEKRKERADRRKASVGVIIAGGKVEELEDNRPSRMRSRVHAKMKERKKPTEDRKGKVPIDVPITVRALSEAIGWKLGKLLFQLLDLGLPKSVSANSIIDIETAETIALEAGVELDIRKTADAEEKLMAGLGLVDEPETMLPRAPVVTIMGHVDHGKTSLLDRIRVSNVVDTEAGGITQVIRAWRVMHRNHPITFIDTPGHEAFTKMRARGAQVTDIAVIVVAATDGVMPQTEEAINHAKAAGVQLVVAINKIDMPNANIMRTRQQLYSMDVLPDDMGGHTPFVETSAATGKGIEELLEAILLVSEFAELRANPDKPAHGTCLEAYKKGEEGVFATMLVRTGTLRKGDVVLCGATFGRVRAMYDDLGRPIDEAGPSVPVRVTGLDDVPDAGDPFHVVPELSAAREVADKRKQKRIEESLVRHQPLTLETLAQKKIAELKIILKADFRGSIEAIRKELEKLQHEEVRVRLLHAGIGAVTVSDVELAMTSPTDTLLVGFNAVPDIQALAMAEQRGMRIGEYSIIYKLTDDIRSAMEGKLKPREEVVHLGRAVIRETFKISKVGTIAGCYVTQGIIERSSKVRVIREGVVVYPPAERTVGLESLKRFKEDVREVREGFDCGMKIAGYDDIKVGDVIEAYRIDIVQRTL